MKTDTDSNSANGWIKAEPELTDKFPPLAAHNDEDIYEDAGDLDFTYASQGLYLTRLPKMLWDNWSQLDNEQEIRLGTVRIEGQSTGVERVRGFPFDL